MKRVKLIMLFLFILLSSLLFTGCNSYNEMNNVMIIDGIGIDKENDDYVIAFNSYVSDDKYEIHKIKCSNINDSFNDIYLEINKKIYLSHLNILVLSSNLDNDDIIDIINTFNNRNDLRGTFNVVLMHKYDEDTFSNTSLKMIEILQNNHLQTGNIYPTTFNDVITDYLNMGISYIPIFDNDLNILGMHSIFAEYRFYNNLESSFLNLLMGKNKSLAFTIGEENVKVEDIYIRHKIKDNNITFIIDITYESKIDEKEIENYIRDNITTLLNSDINMNYFKELIQKYENDQNKDIKISFDTVINFQKSEKNNVKDGDLIEKD